MVVASSKNTDLFTIVAGGVGSSLWACRASHQFVYYPAVRKEKLESAPYIEEVKIP